MNKRILLYFFICFSVLFSFCSKQTVQEDDLSLATWTVSYFWDFTLCLIPMVRSWLIRGINLQLELCHKTVMFLPSIFKPMNCFYD